MLTNGLRRDRDRTIEYPRHDHIRSRGREKPRASGSRQHRPPAHGNCDRHRQRRHRRAGHVARFEADGGGTDPRGHHDANRDGKRRRCEPLFTPLRAQRKPRERQSAGHAKRRDGEAIPQETVRRIDQDVLQQRVGIRGHQRRVAECVDERVGRQPKDVRRTQHVRGATINTIDRTERHDRNRGSDDGCGDRSPVAPARELDAEECEDADRDEDRGILDPVEQAREHAGYKRSPGSITRVERTQQHPRDCRERENLRPVLKQRVARVPQPWQEQRGCDDQPPRKIEAAPPPHPSETADQQGEETDRLDRGAERHPQTNERPRHKLSAGRPPGDELARVARKVQRIGGDDAVE